MRSYASLLVVGALISRVSSHFTMEYPQTRGFDEDLEPQFCGGFNVSQTRSPFPLTSAPILIDSHHPSAEVAILISFSSNPISFTDFNTTSTGATYGLLKTFSTITGEGEFCFNVDVSSLGVAGVTNGSVATIQVEFNGGDGVLLQCADVILDSSYQVPSNVTSACSSSLNGASASGTGSAATTTTAGGASTTASAVGSAGTTASKTGDASGLQITRAVAVVGLAFVAVSVLL